MDQKKILENLTNKINYFKNTPKKHYPFDATYPKGLKIYSKY